MIYNCVTCGEQHTDPFSMFCSVECQQSYQELCRTMSLGNQIMATLQMKSIKQVIDDIGEDWNDTHIMEPNFIGHVRSKPMFIAAILEHTAVIHPIELPNERSTVNLGGVDVWPQDVRWRRRNIEEIQIRIINKRAERKAMTL